MRSSILSIVKLVVSSGSNSSSSRSPEVTSQTSASKADTTARLGTDFVKLTHGLKRSLS